LIRARQPRSKRISCKGQRRAVGCSAHSQPTGGATTIRLCPRETPTTVLPRVNPYLLSVFWRCCIWHIPAHRVFPVLWPGGFLKLPLGRSEAIPRSIYCCASRTILSPTEPPRVCREAPFLVLLFSRRLDGWATAPRAALLLFLFRSWLQDTLKIKLVDFAWNPRFFYLPGARSLFPGKPG